MDCVTKILIFFEDLEYYVHEDFFSDFCMNIAWLTFILELSVILISPKQIHLNFQQPLANISCNLIGPSNVCLIFFHLEILPGRVRY